MKIYSNEDNPKYSYFLKKGTKFIEGFFFNQLTLFCF